MNLLRTLFSFRGRAPRSTYWLITLLTTPVLFTQLATMDDDAAGLLPDGLVAWTADNDLLLSALSLTAFVSLISVQVRRWHDRDKSAWWLLINLIPLIGGLWALIENGLLAGTEGANRYGPDPTRRPHHSAPTTGHVSVLADLDQRKQCPHCGEFVRTEARRCEWCDSTLATGWHHAMP
jgi:uncharacterized membrane protein YhaH (DUF805 family)